MKTGQKQKKGRNASEFTDLQLCNSIHENSKSKHTRKTITYSHKSHPCSAKLSALSVVVDLKVQQTNTTLLYSKHSVCSTNVVINVQIYMANGNTLNIISAFPFI